MRQSTGFRRIGWAAVAALLVVAWAAPTSASRDSGNNGTVKIHEGATETEPIVHNDPHVCTFHLHFFFADPFQAGSWEIQEWAPGDKGTVVLAGTYDTNADGEDRQPEEGAYQLPDGHYKLFWDGDASKHDKMKVFWVDCPAETTAPSQSVAATSEATATPVATETVAPSGTVAPTGTAAPTMTVAPTETAAATTTVAPTSAATGSPAPSQSVLGETGAPAPSQSVLGETGAPGGNVSEGPTVTLPPTDMVTPSRPDPDGWRSLLVALAVLLTIVLVLTPNPEGRPGTSR